MKIVLLISLFISWNALSSDTAPVNTPETIEIDSIVSGNQLNYSTKDKITANHIASIYDMTLHDFLTKSKITQTKNEIVKNPLFSHYKPWIINLEKLASVKSTTALVKFCKYEVFKNKLSVLTLQKNLERICANQYIEKTMKEFSEKNFFSAHNLDFLKKYVSLIYYRVSNKKLISFLEKTSFNKKIHKETSEIFSEFFMRKNRVPSSQVLATLELTPVFNEFVQRRGLSDANSKQVFYEELDHYASKILKLADNGASEKIIIKKIAEINNYFSLSLDKLPLKKSFDKIHYLGKSLLRRKYYDSSTALFSQVLKSKNKDQKEEAQFDTIWAHISQKNFSDAYKFIKSQNLITEFNTLNDPKLMFWIAHILEKNDKDDSLKLHSKLIGKFPLSYYAILSTKHLKEVGSKLPTLYEIIPTNTVEQNFISKNIFNDNQKRSLTRLRIWTKLGLIRFQELEKSILSDEPSMQVLMAKVFKNERDYLASFKVIYKGIYSNKMDLTKDVLAILYPKPFWESVVNNKSNIDPILAISLIRQESGFNPEARSRVGATGLMQLMPATAKRFYRRATVKRLEDPFLNIKIGTTYFSNLLKRYDTSVVHSLAAYNAGEGRVDRWQNEYFNGDTALHNIEEIPFLETRKYVKLIFRNVFFYKYLEEPATNVASSENLKLLFAEYLGIEN